MWFSVEAPGPFCLGPPLSLETRLVRRDNSFVPSEAGLSVYVSVQRFLKGLSGNNTQVDIVSKDLKCPGSECNVLSVCVLQVLSFYSLFEQCEQAVDISENWLKVQAPPASEPEPLRVQLDRCRVSETTCDWFQTLQQ